MARLAARPNDPETILLALRAEAMGCRACPPSYLLRIPEPDKKQEEYRRFVEDLLLVRDTVG
jgi:hypothetical protein